MLCHIGVRGLGALVENRLAFVRYVDRRLEDADLFVRLNDVDCYRLAFVFCPPQVRACLPGLSGERRSHAVRLISELTSRLNTQLYREGRVCFDEHTLADLGNRVGLGEKATYTVMACCPGNPLLKQADLNAGLDRLIASARHLVVPMLGRLTAGTPIAQSGVAGPAGWSDAQ